MRKRFISLFAGTWLIYLAFLPPGIYSVDGYSMLSVADSLVTRQEVTVPSGSGVTGKDGRSYSPWYPLQSLLAVPVVAVAIKLAGLLHLPVHYVESLAVTVLPAFYTAVTVPLVYLISISLGGLETGPWLAAISYGFGTIALVYTRDFYADPLLALLMALGILLAFKQCPIGLTTAVTALAVLAKPTGIILGLVLAAYLLWKTGRFLYSLLPAVGTAMGLALYCAYNFHRFGALWAFGQPSAFSVRYLPEGLAGLVVSPGGGLIWFCPCLLLSVVALWQIRLRRPEAWAVLALAACSLLLHSLWRWWAGGWSWGPRLLLPILPGLVALTSVPGQRYRKLLACLALLGFLMTAPNLLSFYARYESEAVEQNLSERDLLWKPSRSPLLHAWPAAVRQIQDARQTDVRQLLAQRTGNPASTIASSRALRIVAVWWWVLPVVHLSRDWGILISGFLILSGIWLLGLARNSPSSAGSAATPPATA